MNMICCDCGENLKEAIMVNGALRCVVCWDQKEKTDRAAFCLIGVSLLVIVIIFSIFRWFMW